MDHNAQFVEAQREFLSLDPLLTLLVDITEQPIQRLIENLSDTKIADRDFPARSGPKVDIIRLRSSQLRSLSQKMLGLIQRTMVLEVHIAKLRGELTVETSRKRYRQFVDSLSKEDIRRKICAEYPVLVQSCVDQADASVKFFREVMERVCWDWEEICLKFGIDRSSTLIDLVPGSGDSHNGGKSVCVLTFSDHRQLIYKPRSLKVDLSFQNLLEWFNVNGFELQHRTIKIVDKVDYGWTEFVSSYPCLNESDQALFYERLGQLLAIMYLTGTTDQHFENIVAAGEHPVSVDLETVFKPLLTSKRHTIADDVALSILADSVISVGILPAAVGDQAFDVSGIGRGGVTPFKVPSIEFRETDQIRVGRKQQYVKALNNVPSSVHGTLSGTDKGRIMVGFNNACRIAMEFKEALCCDDGPVSNFEGARVRIVLRSSLYYASLLSESTHPTLQRSSSRKERFYDDLWAESKFKAHLEKVCISERSQLLKGDIPYFSMEVDDLKLRGGDGTIIEGIVDKSGLDLTYDRIEFADEISVKRQSSFVRMALAIPAESRPLQSEFSFLSQAVHVGDILAQQMIEKDDTISWHSLNLSSEDSSKATYRIGIVGSDLYEGLAGTTLFFL
ncbi:MAG: type 2 lanthipeptide synthetase LanM, partial [Proteobacteria bacterium]|nr:type 2 lanthipeptide synthetase LanM [Pseudomonadota bacterium]